MVLLIDILVYPLWFLLNSEGVGMRKQENTLIQVLHNMYLEIKQSSRQEVRGRPTFEFRSDEALFLSPNRSNRYKTRN